MALNSSTSAEPQATSSTRAEQLDRLHELQQLVDADQDQDEVLDAAQDLIHEVDIAARWLGRSATSPAPSKKRVGRRPVTFPDEGDESGDKNDGAAA